MCVCSFQLKSLRHVCVYLCAQVLVCMCVLISKIVSSVLVSKLVRLARSISSQAKVNSGLKVIHTHILIIILL